MRKIIKHGRVCEHCGTKLTMDTYENFCGLCKEKISEERYPLESTVFFEGRSDSQHYEFCSWKCIFDYLKNFPLNKQTVDFITLPYISGSKSSFMEELNECLNAMIVSTKQSEEVEE